MSQPETRVTVYAEIGVELRAYSTYDGRGEGAADVGSEVFTLDGVKVDTLGAVSPASWVMEKLLKLRADEVNSSAAERIREYLRKFDGVEPTGREKKEIEKARRNLFRLTGAYA